MVKFIQSPRPSIQHKILKCVVCGVDLFVLVFLGGRVCVRFTAHVEDTVSAVLEC